MSIRIHPTAVIDASAQLGADVTVGPYAVIHDNVVIGDRCRIDSHAVILPYTRMGAENRVHSHALVGGEPQDLKFRGEISWLEIGTGNVIREFATLHRGTEGGGGVTRIGDGNLLMAYIHVAHDCQIGSHIVMSNNATLAGHVIVDDYAIISGLAAVHQFVRIGRHAFLGGMSGLSQDLPPWMLAAGARATVMGPNMVGLRRAGASSDTVRAMKEAYRIVWRSGLLRPEALKELKKVYSSSSEVYDFIEFIEKSDRGICPGAKNGAPEA